MALQQQAPQPRYKKLQARYDLLSSRVTAGTSLVPDTAYADFLGYLSSKDPSCVNYMQFSDEVESVFTTKNLERTPTAEVRQFVPRPEVDPSRLLPEEEQILQKTMHRLAEKVRVRRIQIFPLFEDYDKVHIGNVTRSQFHRVLSELELGGMVNAFEFGIIYRKFEGRSGVNYISFCEMIDEYAQTKWSDPTLK